MRGSITNGGRGLHCQMCGEWFETLGHIASHAHKVHGRKWTCHKCHRKYSLFRELLLHKRRAHGFKGNLGNRNPKLDATKVPDKYTIAWAAGIFEGEGSCGLAQSLVANVSQKDRWLCDRLQDYFGGGVYEKHARNASGMPITFYTWGVTATRAKEFLGKILPHLSPRRTRQVTGFLKRWPKKFR
jgi:hypothetical protein